MSHYPNTAWLQLARFARCVSRATSSMSRSTVRCRSQLNGTFHRVHPDAQFPPKFDTDQFFNGDGMVSLFRFRNGQIDFKQRYVQTDKWKIEHAAGRSLFGAYRNPLTDDESVKGKIRGTANTNVMVHAGQLYAMKEDSPCFLMDPLTLESKGYTDFGGKLKSQTFCAHPKIDPKTGNFCGFGYATKGLLTTDMAYFEIDPKGNVLKESAVREQVLLHDARLRRDRGLRGLPHRADRRVPGSA